MMSEREISRRTFVGAMTAASLRAGDDWADLFDGRSLAGWRPSENKDTWKVVDGHLVADGPRSHLFYDGPIRGANFRNFELEVEGLARPLCNSGVYFHTTYQEEGFPRKGYEVQINNTALGERGYRERKKTGSLYGIRNNYKQLVADDEWFTLRVTVRGKNIQVWLNGMQLVNFTEATPPIIPAGNERDRFLDRGTFALQGHDPGSRVRIRRVRVRPLADDAAAPPDAAEPLTDEPARDVLELGRRNIPLVDYHVHLKSGLTIERALAHWRLYGIQPGLAINCGQGFPVQDEATARAFVDSMKGQPVFLAMQAEGREWTQMFGPETVRLFDYVFTDSMTWTDNRGRRMRIWIKEEVGRIADSREFMETLVDRTVGILENEPIDIYVNPTFLPEVIAADYDALWTEERMRKVVDAAARNQVAIEINNRYKLPSPGFLRMAKEAGCKFAFGTNNGGPDDLGRCEYALRMTKELGLTWQDLFYPRAWQPRAVDRHPEALKG